ncbi:hypothetical protein CPB83DRAFT_791794 [Crepidotus variabilis]|uniref:NADH:flavin oxidoreductase/NADH oxidase N-terminal domain-containing protein n=1 Tax=Crepidotus variabilis TaxID=179855 RepID=A0A9P6JPE3_9AGAR|nr:hypothetical protein CPB83DRAFT_791794 [Crepidotus variabilis]
MSVSLQTSYKQETPAGTAAMPQPGAKPLPKLFQPLRIRGVEFQNRIFVAPMCQYSAEDGIISPWHLAHLGGIFTRGPGLTILEATAVIPEGRVTPHDVGLWSDEHIAPLKTIVDFAHSQKQNIGIQLAHAGRKASTTPPWLSGSTIASKEKGGWPDNVWAPSPIPFNEEYPSPHELTLQGIQAAVTAFAVAAKRAVVAGFDVIEVHSAHGYLLSSFLSPTSNHRSDKYGGSFENRIRLLIEVVDAIRAVIPTTMPVFVRISGTEWLEEVAPTEPSWRSEDTARLAPILADHSVDLLDISAGGNSSRQAVRSGPGYQVPFARAAKKAVGSRMLVSAVGGLHDSQYAESVLESGDADIILVGRQFQKNPGLVWNIADDLDVQVHWANQIRWGFAGRGTRGLGTSSNSETVKL